MVKAQESVGTQPRSGDGKYTFWQRGESAMDLGADSGSSAYLDEMMGDAERHAALIEGGYVEPRFFSAMTDPKSRAGIEAAWDQSFASAGHTADDSGYPKMPDGYTPGGHEGRSIEGIRRTYRRAYEVDGWNVRMHGSVTAAKRFSQEVGKTFEMPVTVESPDGRKSTGWVLVTNGGAGNWAVTSPKEAGERGQNIASAVQAILEAKRPTMIPRHAGGLAARARERKASEGIVLSRRLRSTWMDSVGYDNDEGMMVMRTSAGNVYGYSIPRELASEVANSDSPGATFNHLIRRKGYDNPVSQCEKCRSVYPIAQAHRCKTNRGQASANPQRTAQLAKIGSLQVATRSAAIRQRFASRLAGRGESQVDEARRQALSGASGEPVTPRVDRSA